MARKLLPLVVAIVVVLGCKKKPSTETGGDAPAPGSGAAADAGVAYTIKIRAEQAGDKTDETETETGAADISMGGKGGQEKVDKKLEFTEHIIDMPAGAPRPNKLTRAYRVAKNADKTTGAAKVLPYQGKTVTIEKKGAAYEFTADGKKLGPVDAADFAQEFSKAPGGKIEAVLPKTAVKVGEAWTADAAGVKALTVNVPFPIDVGQSKVTGKLTRAYTKDGKQWGVIDLDCDLVVAAPGGANGGLSGTIKMVATLDTAIDGSSRDGTMNRTLKVNIAGNAGGGEIRIVADVTEVKTVKTAK